MELAQLTINQTTYSAYEVNQLIAGDKIKFEIETEGDDNIILDTEVPVGKKWELVINVKVLEADL